MTRFFLQRYIVTFGGCEYNLFHAQTKEGHSTMIQIRNLRHFSLSSLELWSKSGDLPDLTKNLPGSCHLPVLTIINGIGNERNLYCTQTNIPKWVWPNLPNSGHTLAPKIDSIVFWENLMPEYTMVDLQVWRRGVNLKCLLASLIIELRLRKKRITISQMACILPRIKKCAEKFSMNAYLQSVVPLVLLAHKQYNKLWLQNGQNRGLSMSRTSLIYNVIPKFIFSVWA